MLIGYLRVSSQSQDVDAQRHAFEQAGVKPDQVYEEKASGARADRPQLATMLRALRAGDVVCVYRLDRLARSTRDALNILHAIHEKGATVRSLTEAFDLSTPQGKAMFGILSIVAELDRDAIRLRQRDGIAAAQSKGAKFGRPPADPAKLAYARQLIGEGKGVREASRLAGVSYRTVYRAG